MHEGIIQFFLPEKGYGYIRIPETREEIFVQKKDLLDLVEKGDSVRFEIRENQYGLFAAQVKKIPSFSKKAKWPNTSKK